MEDEISLLKLAWSFPGTQPPNQAELIKVIHRSGQDWYFYKDKEGNYWYQSQSQMEYELAAEERERARRKARIEQKRR